MESVLIQSNFPHRISLSQASQITGYHQDYLGLLCRLGKIEANKIGRNWYTTQSEINKFLSPDSSNDQAGFMPESEDGSMDGVSTNTLQSVINDNSLRVSSSVKPSVSIDSVIVSTPVVRKASAPAIVENYVISDLRALPISIVKKPALPQHHTLQSLITRTKLEQLKQEVLQIAGFMDSVSNELAEHRSILQKHEAMLASRKDLASNYASNIDFGLNNNPSEQPAKKVTMIEDNNLDIEERKLIWLWPSLAVSFVVIISLIIIGGGIPKTVNYATTIYYKFTNQSGEQLNPQVAGDSDIMETQGLEITK